MTKKCAKLNECEDHGSTIVYSAKACNGDEKFTYNSSEKILGDTCPANQLVEVDYYPEGCSTKHFCQANSMTLATDNHCAADCGVF